MKVWTVVLEAQDYAEFDNFSGTKKECIAWCKENDYPIGNEPGGAHLAEVEVEDGSVTYCYQEIDEI